MVPERMETNEFRPINILLVPSDTLSAVSAKISRAQQYNSLNEAKRQDQNSGILGWLESTWKANVGRKLCKEDLEIYVTYKY